MDKQRVQKFGDLLLVRKIQGAVVWDPNALQVHGTNLHNMSDFFALQDTISTTSGHASDIQ
jgi:hypothetical protein